MPIPIGRSKKQPQIQPNTKDIQHLSPQQLSELRPTSSLPVGSIVGKGSLTDTEKKVLEQMGWQPGQPIPSEISKQLSNMEVVKDLRELQRKLKVEAENAVPVPLNTPPLKVPKPTLLEDLPPDKQASILQSIKSAIKDTELLVKAANEEAAGSKRSVQFEDPSLEAAARYVLENSNSSDIVIDSKPLTTDNVIAASDVQHPSAYLTKEELDKLINKPEVQSPVNSVKEEARQLPKDSDTGLLKKHQECPHCGWDQDKPEPAEMPSSTDKSAFLQSVLGQIRFKKSYSLLGDKVVVVFRTLKAEEADLCMTQTVIDMAKTAQADNEVAFWRTVADYRLAISIDSVYIDGRGKIYTAPEDIWTGFEIAEEEKPKDSTILPLIVQYIYSNILVLESLRRAIGVNCFNFHRMVEFMEARVLDTNFWKATEDVH